ncbi:MAG: SpoIID/LytB domain-containing protein [Planctomycetaceae bacterium]|nr:SpoIID/LytB domain-containing protein [Planctomycetaceae bacterium]
MRARLALLVLILGVGFAFYWRSTEKQNPGHAGPGQEDASPESTIDSEEPFRDSPEMRVSLTNSSRNSFRFACSQPFEIYLEEASSPQQRMEPFPDEVTVEATTNPLGIQIGAETFPGKLIRLKTSASPDFWVNDHQYRGEIWFHRLDSGRLLAVNHVPLEEYLGSVVDSEMPATFPDNARKAQAIIARTYALYRRQETADEPYFDLYASTLSQQYLGFQYRTNGGRRLAGESKISRRLARETAGQVCLYEGKLFSTYYSAVCGGKTTEGSILFPDAVPLLQPVPCEYCAAAELYKWERRWSIRQASDYLSREFSRRGIRFGELTKCENVSPEPGPAARFRFEDGRISQTLTGQQIRNLFPDLPSPTFKLELTDEQLHFLGAGHGHGVGLCQWGARGMAIEEKTVEDILNHYYPGVTITPRQD